MTHVQGTEWRPKGAEAGNEVGRARRNKMSRKIGFESEGHGSLVVWGRDEGGLGPGRAVGVVRSGGILGYLEGGVVLKDLLCDGVWG